MQSLSLQLVGSHFGDPLKRFHVLHADVTSHEQLSSFTDDFLESLPALGLAHLHLITSLCVCKELRLEIQVYRYVVCRDELRLILGRVRHWASSDDVA